MKKSLSKLLALITSLFALSAGFLVNHNLKRHYKPGDYVPEKGAYFVERVEDPAGLVKAHKFVTPTDNYYNSQKTRSHSVDLLGNLEDVWGAYTGKGTTVAIIDDGFDVDHPEFTRSDGSSAILQSSRYYYSENPYAYVSNVYCVEYKTDPTCLNEDWEETDWDDDENPTKWGWATHGTNTSTTAAAPMNNGGGVGIAPEADILALKIDFSFSAIRAAINYAVAQGVDVINMSLGAYAENFTDGFGISQNGGSTTATFLNEACQAAYDAGIIVVAAAGNEATYRKSYPACSSKVIGVGALFKNSSSTLAPFTNYVATNQTGEINVDILAPGYVYTAHQLAQYDSQTQSSTAPSGHSHGYDDTQGTSFSSPIVAGAACLWKQKYPNGTPADFLTQLQTTASGIGTYTSKKIPISKYEGYNTDIGPSNITNGRLNVANLLDISEPYITIKHSSIDVVVGSTKQVQIDVANGTVSYSTGNPNIATVNNSGLVTGVSAGSTTLTVTASKNNKTDSVTIPVTVGAAIACESLSLDPSSTSIEVGQTYSIEPTITTVPANASRVFLYQSHNENVATVDIETGVVTGVSAGQTSIYVTALDGDGEATLDITVTPASSPACWEKVTSSSDLSNGDYLIVYENGSVAFNGGLDSLDTASNTISVSISNNKITYDSATEAAKFTINTYSTGYSVQSASGKYIYGTSGSNVLNTSTSATVNSISISSGDVDIVSNTSHLRYNSTSGQTRFRYFKSGSYSNQQAIQLYKASNATPPAPSPTVTSVTVSPSSLNLDLNGNATGNLTATVNGTNNPSQSVTWSSANTGVATVSNGTVTAVGAGTTTITATSQADGTKSGSCTVTVTDSTPSKTLSSISVSGYTTEFTVGDTFSFGGTVTAHFSDSSSSNVTSSATFSGYNMNTAGNQTVTVSYTYSGTTKTTTYQINVASSGGSGGSGTISGSYTIGWGNASGEAGTYSNYSATSGSVTDLLSFDCQKNSGTNDPFVTSSNILRLYYHSGGSGCSITIRPVEGVTFTSFTVTTDTTPTMKYSVDGAGSINANRNNKVYTPTASFEATEYLKIQNGNTSNVKLDIYTITLEYERVDESDKIMNKLVASYSGGDIFVGGELDTSKVSVTAQFSDSSKYSDEVLTSSDYSLTGFSSATAGTKTVTVTYTGQIETSVSPLTTTFSVTVKNDSVTNVTVTNTKTYHPGETIVKSDITVNVSWESGNSGRTEDFTFESYQFTYDDAPSGGSAKSKQFSINYAGNSYNFSVNVSRVAHEAVAGVTDTLTRATTGVSSGSTTYTSWSGKTLTSGSTYAGESAGSNDAIQLRSNGSSSGVVMTASSGNVVKVSVSWQSSTSNGRTLNVYGKNTSYTSAANLYSSNTAGTLLGTIVYGTSTELVISGDYAYIGVRSDSGAMYLSELSVYFGGGEDTPTNLANYIMYEDTNNQCESKLDTAISYFESMSKANRELFMTDTGYVVSTARERFLAWASHEGKTINYVNNDYVVSQSKNVLPLLMGKEGAKTSVLVVVITLVSLTAFGGYFFQRKRKEQ